MATIARSRRIFSLVLKSNKNPRLYSTVSANGPKEPIISSSILGDPSSTTPPPVPPPESAEAARVGGQPWSFLKYTLLAAVTGVAATAGYATYGMSISVVSMNFLRVVTLVNTSYSNLNFVICRVPFLLLFFFPSCRINASICFVFCSIHFRRS